MDQPILCVTDLSIDFQTEDQLVHAIQDISFEIFQGKTFAMVGESGSGKSVSALSIMGLLPKKITNIVKGKIEFKQASTPQIDLLQVEGHQMQTLRGSKIGMIFQEPMSSLNPLMKCGRQVMEAILLHKKISASEALKETLMLFDEVKLPNPAVIAERYPHEISGGQKQRVMIAMAICCNPLLLIADEPTTALDVTVQKSIMDLLKELQRKRGMAILFISHDLNLVKGFADSVMIMYRGKCIEFGSTQEIFSKPIQAYTIGLLNCRPDKNERVKYLKTVQESIEASMIHSDHANKISDAEYSIRIEKLSHSKKILELRDLKIWYPVHTNFFGKTTSWFKAVNGVNLSIHEGSTLGLVGESGCGKTTIGKAIVKLVKTTQGEILYKGKNIQDFSKSELADYKREVQIIFQDPYSSLNPRIPIGDAIMEPMHVHGIHQPVHRKEKVLELLNKVGLLPEHYHRYPHEFSGGQRQRICIARCLALQPSFIICDESVSALDVSVQAQVLNLLVSLREEFKLSYLFISHDLDVVKHISDHIAVMQNGMIEELNDAEKIYFHPTKPYTKSLIESTYSI